MDEHRQKNIDDPNFYYGYASSHVPQVVSMQ
jgi:hypothetical protein